MFIEVIRLTSLSWSTSPGEQMWPESMPTIHPAVCHIWYRDASVSTHNHICWECWLRSVVSGRPIDCVYTDLITVFFVFILHVFYCLLLWAGTNLYHSISQFLCFPSVCGILYEISGMNVTMTICCMWIFIMILVQCLLAAVR